MSEGQTCLEETNPASGVKGFAAMIAVSQDISALKCPKPMGYNTTLGQFLISKMGFL